MKTIQTMKTVKIFLAAALLVICVGGAASAQDVSAAKRSALDFTEALRPAIDKMAIDLWNYSEIALREHLSAEMLAALMEKEGFTLERGVAGMPTAFVASYGSGSPVIGILAEYDALPGVGNAAVPHKQAREDGVTSGQGCGHNLFGAGSVGGALALKRAMEKHKLPGTIKLFGSPAEETVVGKVYMANAGVFDGLDAVLVWHPGLTNKVSNQAGRALNNFTVEFFGQAAHSSADPWNGRSALDAVELMNHAVNMMREHIPPTARIHYVITNGGDAPNVVPEYAKVWYFARGLNREEVQDYYDRIQKMAEGAALSTGTTHKVFLITGVHEYQLNRPLQEALQANLELVGAPEFDETDHTFAKALQKVVGKEESGYDGEIAPLPDEPGPVEGGSSDVAEVSYLSPTGEFSVTTAAADVPWHSWATSACHGTAAARKGAVVAAKIIAATGVDLLTDADLRKRTKEFFDKATAGKTYQSPIPRDQKVPLPKDN